MALRSIYAIFTLFLVFLLASSINARTGPGDYWKDVMKDQPMPDAIEGLVGSVSKTLTTEKKTDCDTHTKRFTKDFDPQPNISVYHDDVKLKEKDQFVDDFEPRPNISSYHDDAEVKVVKDFEPRPSVTSYSD